MILKFLKGFRKLAVFLLLLTKFSIFFSKLTCLLLAIFIKFIFNQKEKRSFVWSKTFDFLFQKPSNFYSEKKSCSLKVDVLEFQKYRKNNFQFLKFLKNKHEHELFYRYISCCCCCCFFFYFLVTNI